MNEDQQWHLGLEEIESYFPDPPQGTSQGENNLEPAQGHSEDDNNLQSEVVSRNALTTAAPATKDDTQVGSVKLGTDNVLMGMNADGNLSINSPGHSSSEAQNLDNPQQVTAEYNDQRRRATRLNPRSFNAGVSAPFDSGVGSIPNHQNLDNPRQVTAANNNQGRRTARNETDPKFFHDGASDPFDFSGGMPPSQAYAPDNFASHDPLAEALGRTDQGHISGIPPSLEEADPLGVTSPVVEQHTLTNNDAVVQSGETIPSPSGAVQASSNDQVPEPMSGVMMQASATQASATQASATTTNVAFKTEPSEPTGNLSFAPAGNIDPDEVQPSAEPGSSSRHTSSNPQATTLPQSDVRNTSMTPRNNIRAFPVVLTSLVIPKGISLPGQHFDVPTKDMGQMYQPIDKPVGQPSQPYDVSTKDLGQIPQVPDKHMKLSSQLSSISTEDFSQNQEAANKEPSPLDQLYDVPTGDFEQEYQLLDTQLCQPGDLYDVPTNDFGQSYRPVDKQLSLPDQSYSVSTEDFGPKYHQAVDMRMGAPGRLYGISTEGFGQKYQPVDQQLSLPGPRHGVPTENFGQTYQPAAERLSLSGQQQYGHSTEDLGQNYQTIYEQMSVSGQPYGAYTEDFGQNNQAADHVVPPEAFGQNYEAAEPMGFSGQLYAPPNEDFGQIYPRTHEQLVVSGQLYALTGDIGQNYQAVGKQTWNLPQPQFDESSLRNRSSMKEGFLRAGSSTSYPAASISDFPASATDDRNAAINDNSENETTAAQDTIGTPETVNDDTYTNLFSDWNAVVAYENQREPNPEYDQDQTVPQTDVEHQIYVRLIVQAILDISNTRDYPAESAARGLKPPQAYVNFRENKYSDIEIQILAWKILVCLETSFTACYYSQLTCSADEMQGEAEEWLSCPSTPGRP